MMEVFTVVLSLCFVLTCSVHSPQSRLPWIIKVENGMDEDINVVAITNQHPVYCFDGLMDLADYTKIKPGKFGAFVVRKSVISPQCQYEFARYPIYFRNNGDKESCTTEISMWYRPAGDCGDGAAEGYRHRIRCPECRVYTNVPSGGLSTNYQLKELLTRLKAKEIESTTKRLCKLCENQIPEKEFWHCLTCANEEPQNCFCSKCGLKSHNGHKMKELSEILNGRRMAYDQINSIKIQTETSVHQIERKVAGLQDILDDIMEALDGHLTDRFDHILSALKSVDICGEEMLLESVGQASAVIQKEVKDVWQYIPIINTLKTIVSVPQFLDVIKNRKPNDDGIIEDFIDGSACAKHPLVRDPNKITIAIQLYYDDMEIANPLGPHAGTYKMGFFYFSVKNFPPYFRKSMANVFTVALAKTQDLKIYGYDPVLEKIAEDIKYLETNGFEIETDNGKEKIYGSLLIFAGDNLARHTILGFQESFSAYRFCSHCMATKQEIQTTFSETSFNLRTPQMFDHQLNEVLADRSGANQKEYGIKSRCRLLDTNYWHVATNRIGDLLHDILEGIGPFEMKAVLYHLIYVEKHFTLDQLNSRIVYFAYGFTDSKNRPVEISDLKGLYDKNDKKLKQRGLHFWCLMRLLPLMVGDLIPHDNVYWQFFLELRQVCDILFAQKWTLGMSVQFREIYAEHQQNFIRLFPDLNLIPKHHFVSHYALFAQTTGPPYKNMLASEEMKGNYFERTSGLMCNFRNVTSSLAKKHQIFAFTNIFTGKVLKDTIEIHQTSMASLDVLPCSCELKEFLSVSSCSADIRLITKFSVFGQNYRKGNIISIRKSETGAPIFATLLAAISTNFTPENVSFLVQLPLL